MTLSSLAKKLRLQDASRVLILNAPEGYKELLGELDPETEIANEPDGQFDFAHVFATNRHELEGQIEPVLPAVDYDAILRISYPKGSSGVDTDLNRDKLWKALSDFGFRPVTQVSIDKTWSAMRFRPLESVGK